jgi:hypothetical protein
MDRLPSVMNHNFSQVPKAEIPRSSFNRSHGLKTTFDAGYLVPVFVDEALPGDTFNLNMAGFGRLATPLHPVMDNMHMETFFFAVPIRLLWDNWEKFNGEQTNPGDSTDYLVPVATTPASTGYANGSLYDYMGIPTEETIENVNNLHARAYNLIYNEWFRDENLQDSVTVDTGDGPDDPADYVLKKRGKRHDYFTSCLPWPQKGDAVDLPLGVNAPIRLSAYNDASSVDGLYVNVDGLSGADAIQGNASYGTTAGAIALTSGDDANLYADLSDATAATINQLREAFQIQKLYERDSRGGTRYIELIKSHFGVTSPDARMQRPEYLGGGHSFVNINPVAQTSSTDATSPQGNLSGFGTVSFNRHGFTKSFTEHCVVIGLACVRADLTYQQGINRMWSRQSRFDFYWPALSHIGEQAVLSKEIFADGSASDQDVFGYQERYAEYRYKPSMITGKFRSNYATSLDAWHLAQDFATRPVLDSDFIEENPPIDRVIAVPSEPHMIFDAYFDFKCARPMPTYAVPGMIDHF